MKDIYREYPGVTFEYWYPFKWEDRCPDYLNIVEDREEFQDYMFPPENEGIKNVNETI